MRFKLDENLGRTAVEVLRSEGHNVHTVREQSLSGASDQDVIQACQAELRCLVTLDLDFGNPLVFDPADYAGIAVLRLPAGPSHQDITEACRTLAAGLRDDDIAGRLWIVQRTRIRVHQQKDEP